MNSKLNMALYGEVSAMLTTLTDEQLLGVKTFIGTLTSLPTVEVAPITSNVDVAPKKLSATPKKSAPSKVSDTKAVVPTPSTLTTSSVSVADFASYKCANFDADLYSKTASALGCLGQHGCFKACRGIVYACMDGKVTLEVAKVAVARFKSAKGWA